MTTRTLYVTRHGAADALGSLTDEGRQQARLLGERLAGLPVDAIWHSPLPRAVDSAAETAAVVARHRRPSGRAVLIDQATELIDHIPHVPASRPLPASWTGFFDGLEPAEAAEGERLADALVTRFTAPGARDTHEVLVTHAYQVAWLVRHALGAPAQAWLSLAGMANTAVSVIDFVDGELAIVREVNEQSHLPASLRWTGFADRDGSWA